MRKKTVLLISKNQRCNSFSPFWGMKVTEACNTPKVVKNFLDAFNIRTDWAYCEKIQNCKTLIQNNFILHIRNGHIISSKTQYALVSESLIFKVLTNAKKYLV